jgi:hypothetical protein
VRQTRPLPYDGSLSFRRTVRRSRHRAFRQVDRAADEVDDHIRDLVQLRETPHVLTRLQREQLGRQMLVTIGTGGPAHEAKIIAWRVSGVSGKRPEHARCGGHVGRTGHRGVIGSRRSAS